MEINEIENFLRPRSIVVVGASQRKGSIGNDTVRNFNALNYPGKVYCVNPRYEEVEGFPCFPNVADIPEEIDVAIIAVAGGLVENAIRDCAAKKVSFALIFSAGFAESGEDGLQKQNEILQICKENGIRVIGPNTMGAYNVKDKIAMTFTPASSTEWLSGNVGLVSQSGATGGTILNKAVEEKVGLSYVITTGNQIDLTTLDIAESFIADKDTEIITSYMEAVPDGGKLKELGSKALKMRKPFIVYKTGRSDAGKKAALSHTASLTGSDAAFDLTAKKYGLTTVSSIEGAIDAAKAFRGKKYPQGNKVATVVISGATGIMVADTLAENNFELATLSNGTKNKLKEVVPDYLSVENPVDIASTLLMNPDLYKHCMETLAEAAEVDSLLIHLPIGTGLGGEKFAQDIMDVSNKTNKPIIVLTIGTEQSMAGIRKTLTENNIPAYSNVDSAVTSLALLRNYEVMYRNQQNLIDPPVSTEQHKLQINSEPSVTEPKVKKLLRNSNIPVPNGAVGKNINELLEKVKDLTYPLVAKVVSSQITHKSDVGGVILPIKNEEELKQAYQTITKNVNNHEPNAKIEGVLIEELVDKPFLEIIVGVNRDPVFGPIIMCGLGGVYVEVLKDISQRLAPISEQEALEMIQELNSYPLFTGFRNEIKYDVEALAEVLADISNLANDLGDQWSEIEINPLVVREEGKGVVALDGLITLTVPSKESVQQ